ncbi:hypothetical protein AAG906_022710 [Vitis piasezkii]
MLFWVHCFTPMVLSINLVDEFALIALKAHITYDSQGILATNWSTKSSYCNWYGISCNAPQQRVSVINLSSMGLEGTIAPQVGNLSFLVSLDLSNNYFHDSLPKDIGKCKELQQLNLFNNKLVGGIPEAICNLSKLEELYLGNNELIGEIPKKMNHLRIKVLSFPMNNLTFSPIITSPSLPMDMYANPKLKELNLSSNHLSGKIPTGLGQCIKLQVISLAYNDFTGSIPNGIGNLVELRLLFFRPIHFKCVVGEIPQLLFNISSLRFLNLAVNNLEGEIPFSLSQCRELRVLSLSFNQFTGGIPQAIGSLSNLEKLYLGYNKLTGGIPKEIGNLSNLNILNLASSGISGPIPAEIFNISSLQMIDFMNNSLSGSLPMDICKHLPNLQGLYLAQNHLSGQLPTTLSLCGELLFLSLSFNKFRGSIPREIGNLSKLEVIDLRSNSLIGSIPTSFGNLKALKFLPKQSYGTVGYFNISNYAPWVVLHLLPDLEGLFIGGNEFSGTIPVSISNMSKLIELHVVYNSFSGNVPKDLGNLTKLEVLNLAYNQLTDEHLASGVGFLTSLTNCKFLRKLWIGFNPLKGTLPNSLGIFPLLLKLQRLHIDGNRIRGCFGDLPALQELFLDSNVLAFNIPTSLWSLRDLLVLNLSSNFLTGNLPPEVGNMKSITTLDLSKNLVSGYIPRRMGEQQNLAKLSLSQNRLQGPIPVEFEQFILTIPKSLEALIYLKYLNVSFNKLQGEIPNGGPFVNFTAESFMFNEALCGAPHFQVMACDKNNRTQSWKTKSFILKYILLPVGSTVTLVVFIVLWIRRRDNMEIPTPIDSWLPGTHEKISHQQLLYATNDFGMVYKGVLSNGLTVAIKVFNLEFQGALRSFDSECEVMQGIRHRNLVRIITCCSNLDFKALVLEYMPNGSLEKWLYSHNYFLDLIQRLNIMIDVASALEYLHHDCSSLVVHCDLKPNNVLLDDDMVAHVADFGIAKLLTETESMQQTKTLGTIGYMAPEHGSDGIVSTKSDVYSYGILLMEVFARKKPMDEMFTGDLTLKTWVESLSNSVIQVVDANLLRREDEDLATKLSCLSSIMALALACTTDSPEERIDMKDAVVELKKSRIKLLM